MSNLSPLAEAATTFHEIFLSYVDAGFTEDQALKLVAYIACGPTIEPESP